ncbi:MAG: hypothetical protein ACLQUY_28420 [Ktedonobacterales bacterium]
MVDYFTPLNAYADGGSLLDYEDQNYAIDPNNPNTIDNTRLELLYGLATSAKRYVELNVREHPETGEKRPMVRKFTSHGLGQWGRRDQEEYTLPSYMDPPQTFRELADEQGNVVKDAEGNPVRIPDSTSLGGPLWVYRLQWDYAYTMLNGHYPNGEPLYVDKDGVPWYFPPADEWLAVPAFYQLSVETWADYQRIKRLPGCVLVASLWSIPVQTTHATRLVISWWAVRSSDPMRQVCLDRTLEKSRERPWRGSWSRYSARRCSLVNRGCSISPYVTSGAQAAQALTRGDIRRIGDNKAVSPDTKLKSMHAVVTQYFTHGEAKAANPYGVGELTRRHIEVQGVDIIGKESNRLAQSAAEDTANVLGGFEQFGGRNYGATGSADTPKPPSKTAQQAPARTHQLRPSSLFDEDMPDLLAASCLSRRTIERVAKSEYEAAPDTLAALELAMQLLDPANPHGIASWREIVTVEELAQLLDTTCQDAQDRIRGRKTWTASERTQLILFLTERRATWLAFLMSAGARCVHGRNRDGKPKNPSPGYTDASCEGGRDYGGHS